MKEDNKIENNVKSNTECCFYQKDILIMHYFVKYTLLLVVLFSSTGIDYPPQNSNKVVEVSHYTKSIDSTTMKMVEQIGDMSDLETRIDILIANKK